jgi:hypothetical protein
MYLQNKKKRRLCKLDKIDEEKIYIEKKYSNYHYNEYNQISIMNKIHEIYLKVINYNLHIF